MTALPHLGLYRRVTALALILAPALFLVDNLIHPEEFTRDHEAQQLAEIADTYTRWQLAHLLGFLAIVGFVAAALGLALLVRRRRPAAGLAGGALAVLGITCFAAIVALDGFTWGVLGEVSARPEADPATVALALKDVQESDWSLIYYLTPIGFGLGMLVLIVSAVREKLAPAWAGALLALGVLMVGTETTIISNVYFVVGASVLLAGGVSVAWSITTSPPIST